MKVKSKFFDMDCKPYTRLVMKELFYDSALNREELQQTAEPLERIQNSWVEKSSCCQARMATYVSSCFRWPAEYDGYDRRQQLSSGRSFRSCLERNREKTDSGCRLDSTASLTALLVDWLLDWLLVIKNDRRISLPEQQSSNIQSIHHQKCSWSSGTTTDGYCAVIPGHPIYPTQAAVAKTADAMLHNIQKWDILQGVRDEECTY
ncbi:hypothetical protein OUZ56_009632 [Daphnia magna]|uniref:Uncharacterized protein n=1 Tax=Daphnia magna TaxID=35525 RepID=A0ABR0AGJ9_9CRUS|nr:hypothetical protein OUZ56_009632 [Daphnia magna]